MTARPPYLESARADAVSGGREGYAPINAYALVGDGRTAALICRDGSVDWLCLPHFAGPSVFAALLDSRIGGRFAVRPAGDFQVERDYEDGTPLLRTRFRTPTGVLQLLDLMPLFPEANLRGVQPQRELLRVVEVLAGEVEVEVLYAPRPDYARIQRPDLKDRRALGWSCRFDAQLLHLHSDLPLSREGDTLVSRKRLRQGERRYLSLTYANREVAVIPPLQEEAELRIHATRRWWRDWSARCRYEGPYQRAVARSLVTLRTLTYSLSGAMVAAATTSLPEELGGVRNWDYRYCWLRDASMTLRAFADLGFYEEGEAFIDWLLHATRLTSPRLQVLYDVYGEARVPERHLEHLQGYCGSQPVRVGNEAWSQLQLDVYGEVVLAAYDYVRRGGELDRLEKHTLVGIGHAVCRNWRRPDQGLWEMRDGGRHHTHSKVMCWVALDRLLKLANEKVLEVPYEQFQNDMAEIRHEIETHGYNERLGAYVESFDSERLDASLLLMPRYGFTAADAPRMRSTFERIDENLSHGPLVFRYSTGGDNLPGGEGAFGVCSFWAVDYLARAGRLKEARERFEQLLTLGNDVGLYAEEIDADSGEALGNFPQAYTHVGLITAALTLDHAERQAPEED